MRLYYIAALVIILDLLVVSCAGNKEVIVEEKVDYKVGYDEKDEARSHFNLGNKYYNLGRYKEAIDAYSKAIRLDPDFASAYNNLGLSYYYLGRYHKAIEALKQTTRINPDYAEAHLNLGLAYDIIGRYQEEIDSYRQAIRIESNDALAYSNLCAVYGEVYRYKEAEEACKKAIRIKPDYDRAHYLLGMLYYYRGRKGLARKELKTLRTLNKDLSMELQKTIKKGNPRIFVTIIK